MTGDEPLRLKVDVQHQTAFQAWTHDLHDPPFLASHVVLVFILVLWLSDIRLRGASHHPAPILLFRPQENSGSVPQARTV